MRTLETLCQCGHPYDEHVPLFGHPDGIEECQAEGCMCGEWRPKIFLEDDDVIEARDSDDEDEIDYGGYGWVVQAVTKRVLLKKSNGPLSLTESMIIDSCLARGDEETAKQHIQDWNAARAKASQSRDVSKWVPGDHF